MPVIQTRTLIKLFRGSKGKNKNYIEIALRSKNNLLRSWPAGSDLPKFSVWKSVSLIYAPFAVAIDVKCEPLESLESQQTSCKQVTEGEGNFMAGSLHQVQCGVWECSAQLQCALIYSVYGNQY